VAKNIIRIWKSRNQIFEGLKNHIFKKEDVEAIARERLAECLLCDEYSRDNSECAVYGIAPCCKVCGCSIKIKTRSLSSNCPKGYWDVELTEDEEDAMNEKLDIE